MNFEEFLQLKKPEVKEIKYYIKKTVEKQDCVVLHLDNSEKIYVSVDKYFEYGLNNLEGIDESFYTDLKDEERMFLGYQSALRKLSIKDFSVKQISNHLKIKKQLNSDEIDAIISKLKSYGLLDDERYCVNRTNYLSKQLLSTKQIKNKLNKEGISKDLIDKYVIINSEDEYSNIKELARKYSNSIKNKSVNATKQSILTKLVSAGYSYDLAKECISELNLKNENELALLKKEYDKAKLKYSKKYSDYDLRNHIYSYLVNKGFNSEDIKNVVKE